MKFLVDVQLPRKLAFWLQDRGYDTIHTLGHNLGQVDDRTLWEMADKENRIMISKDEDFFILAMRPKDRGSLLWLRMGNCRTTDLITKLDQHWSEIQKAFKEGQRIVEVF